MKRRTAVLSLAVLTLVIFAFPRASLAQSSSLIGTWKINLEKSKFTPGTAPRSQTNTYQQDAEYQWHRPNNRRARERHNGRAHAHL